MVAATMITKLDPTDSASLKPTAMHLWKGEKNSPREAERLREPNSRPTPKRHQPSQPRQHKHNN